MPSSRRIEVLDRLNSGGFLHQNFGEKETEHLDNFLTDSHVKSIKRITESSKEDAIKQFINDPQILEFLGRDIVEHDVFGAVQQIVSLQIKDRMKKELEKALTGSKDRSTLTKELGSIENKIVNPQIYVDEILKAGADIKNLRNFDNETLDEFTEYISTLKGQIKKQRAKQMAGDPMQNAMQEMLYRQGLADREVRETKETNRMLANEVSEMRQILSPHQMEAPAQKKSSIPFIGGFFRGIGDFFKGIFAMFTGGGGPKKPNQE
jgi:hypothetical protein